MGAGIPAGRAAFRLLVRRRASFDLAQIALSLGVLHHLEDPLVGVRALARLVRPGGELRLYVYRTLDDDPSARGSGSPLRCSSGRGPGTSSAHRTGRATPVALSSAGLGWRSVELVLFLSGAAPSPAAHSRRGSADLALRRSVRHRSSRVPAAVVRAVTAASGASGRCLPGGTRWLAAFYERRWSVSDRADSGPSGSGGCPPRLLTRARLLATGRVSAPAVLPVHRRLSCPAAPACRLLGPVRQRPIPRYRSVLPAIEAYTDVPSGRWSLRAPKSRRRPPSPGWSLGGSPEDPRRACSARRAVGVRVERSSAILPGPGDPARQIGDRALPSQRARPLRHRPGSSSGAETRASSSCRGSRATPQRARAEPSSREAGSRSQPSCTHAAACPGRRRRNAVTSLSRADRRRSVRPGAVARARVAGSQRGSLQGVARAVTKDMERATSRSRGATEASSPDAVGAPRDDTAATPTAARSDAISAFDGMRRLKSKAAWT